jgi:hypothetical protein
MPYHPLNKLKEVALMIRIHYNTYLNDRKDIAHQFGFKMLVTPVYDRHTKSYTIKNARFLRHGMIEGNLNKEEVETLAYVLKDWEFADNESREEYNTLIGFIDEPTDTESAIEPTVEPASEPATMPSNAAVAAEPSTNEAQPAAALEGNPPPVEQAAEEPIDERIVDQITETITSIEVSKEGITEESETALLKLIGVHGYLIRKALGIDELPLVYTDDTISFPWFKTPKDEVECEAYNDFITHLVDKAKSAKSVYEPVMGKDDEKYMFSKFLYRIGINGTNRKTREILMKNLEGSAWKNLTWKKKTGMKDMIEGA